MATHIGACGHPVSRKSHPKCRACWRLRGPDNATPTTYTASICGHPCSTAKNKYCSTCYDRYRADAEAHTAAVSDLPDGIRRLLKGHARSLDDLATALTHTPGQILDALHAMRAGGVNLHELGGRWSLERLIPAVSERTFEVLSRPDNTYHFGIASDQHLCSRYAREDVLNDLYYHFAKAGVDRVLNAGNWIDGEDDKNRFDLSVHGFEPQIDYLVQHYPQRPGLTTMAIWGEDHEGWYSRREAIDVGRFAERRMRDAGRTDWIDLGFVEAKIDLVNANTGIRAPLVLMHPGGGSSYAYSYRPQKIVESMSGGEKPAVLIIGHYHKLDCRPIRNVWTIQAGCQQDQSVFMRKKSLDAQVGGMLVQLEQDPATGAIFRCVSDIRMYYDRAYYNDRWSKTGPVVQAPRFMGGVVPIGG